MDKKYHPTPYNGCNYLSILELKSIHVSKRGSSYKLSVFTLSCNNHYDILYATILKQYHLGILLPGMILGLQPANDRRRYKITLSFIDWAQI